MSELVIRIDIAPYGDVHHQIGSALDNLKKQLLDQTVDDMREAGRMVLWRASRPDDTITVYRAGEAYFVFDDGDQAMKAVQRRFSWARGIVAEISDAKIRLALDELTNIELFDEKPAVLAETLVALLVEDTITEADLDPYRFP